MIQTGTNSGLECDTKDKQIKSTIKDMHLSKVTSDKNNLLVIQMKNWEANNTLIETPISSTGKENSEADDEPKVIDANIQVSTEGRIIENKSASYQITKFANYNRVKKQITFNTYFIT